jgi:hypothetical protein
LLPALDFVGEKLRFAEDNGICLDAYRFESLDFFFGLTERVPIQEAA